MTKPVLIALAQLNAHLGNVNANVSRLAEARTQAASHGAEIIVTPEMYLSGYPCDDLVLRADFMADVAAGIDALAKLTADGVRQLLLVRRLPLMAPFIIRFSFLMAVPSLPALTR